MGDETPKGSETRARGRLLRRVLAGAVTIVLAVLASVIAAAIVGEGRFAATAEPPSQHTAAESALDEPSGVTSGESTSAPSSEPADPVEPTDTAEPTSKSAPPEGAPQPLGPEGAAGVIDEQTNPIDSYAVQLTAAEPATFRATRTNQEGDWGTTTLALYAPTATSTDDESLAYDIDHAMEPGETVTFSYTPAVSGVYFVVIDTICNGLAYRLDVAGTVTAPDPGAALPPFLE